MNKYSYRYKIKNDGTIALYRIYSNVPYIQIPKVIDGRIVSELADHCFSTRNNHLEDTLICNSDEIKRILNISIFLIQSQNLVPFVSITVKS